MRLPLPHNISGKVVVSIFSTRDVLTKPRTYAGHERGEVCQSQRPDFVAQSGELRRRGQRVGRQLEGLEIEDKGLSTGESGFPAAA